MQTTRQTAYVFTQDLPLAAVLIKLGFEMYAEEPITQISNNGRAPVCFFNFKPVPEIGSYMKAWNSPSDSFPAEPGHALNDPNHIFWHCRQVVRNREHLLDCVKNSDVSVYFERHGKSLIVKTRRK